MNFNHQKFKGGNLPHERYHYKKLHLLIEEVFTFYTTYYNVKFKHIYKWSLINYDFNNEARDRVMLCCHCIFEALKKVTGLSDPEIFLILNITKERRYLWKT